VTYGNALLNAAQKAMKMSNTKQYVDNIYYLYNEEDHALYCKLPIGTSALRYADCSINKVKNKYQITALKAAFTPAARDPQWPRHTLWRGLLLENLVQATCAELLRNTIRQCEKEKLNVIFHVHDEIILEVPKHKADNACKRLQDIMCTPPENMDIPLQAEPVIMTRYGKE